MPSTNSLGQRGEKAAETSLCRPSGKTPEYQFRPIPLGDKAELFDFVVHLLGADNNILGAHFFVQVKTTETPATVSCSARFSKDEVAKAVTFKTPCYLVGVDASDPTTERIFIKGIDFDRKKGISKISLSQSLDDDAVRDILYKEVLAHFNALAYSFKSGLNK
ncbi:DUF4365 domain-containing protein [Pseudoxanthomonas sp.]|uniref:DUF4365 domain-containing protein n=1 Tax=Pseudoxanthomonas sp. TaxID=1871049 RepID=UPI0028C50523|nr:DUF4365 domain-containing protein [Pseudoxanthomonas sp.]